MMSGISESELLDRIFETSPTGLVVLTPDGQITRCNRRAEQLLELEESTIEGKSYAEPEWSFVDADGAQLPTGSHPFVQVLESRGPIFNQEFRMERTHADPIYLSISGAPIIEADGTIERLVFAFDDITEHKRRQADLLINEYAIDCALSGIAVANLDQEFISVNPAFLELWGYQTEAEVIGMDVTEFWKHPEEAAKVARTVEATGRWDGELLAVRKDGTTFHAQCSASLVTDDEGDPLALMSSFTDITDRIERERNRRRQTEQLEEFANVVSHDLRNPLNVATGRLELAMDEYDGEHLEPVETALERMEAIIEDTLILAREGQTVGELETVQIREITERCWAMVDTAGATLEVSEEFEFNADRDRVKHVFENLFRNAIEHGHDEVEIRVGVLDGNGFYVEDDGPGIPEDERENVLEPGHTGASGGTGFGLTIVNRIATAHGWDLSITDSAEGGARFEFTNVELQHVDGPVE